MKRADLAVISLLFIGMMTGCGGKAGSSNNSNTRASVAETHGITMTLDAGDELEGDGNEYGPKAAGEVSFFIRGKGEATIDWGDNSPVDTITLSPQNTYHLYDQLTEYTVTITADGIIEFNCIMRGNTVKKLELNAPTLQELRCKFNELTTLDASKCTALEVLECGYNQLKNLDVIKNTALKELACEYNQLTSLDVSKNTALKELVCEYNQLTSLDVSKSKALTALYCNNNQITALDVTQNTALEKLVCHGNQLKKLDVTQNTTLQELWCGGNQLTSLDLSKNTALTSLGCSSNQLTSLDLSKNSKLNYLHCDKNQLSAEALNAMFHDICKNEENNNLYIFGNPGKNTCDRSIAENKGWKVKY